MKAMLLRASLFLVLLVLVGITPIALTQQPKDAKKDDLRLTHVTGMFPTGAKAGTTVTVAIGGERLGGAKGFWCEHPGVTARIRAEGGSETQVQAELTVAAGVPPGLYQWRLLAERGASPPRYLAVSTGADQVETEPNDTAARAGPIAVEGAVHGNLDKAGDIDLFQLTGKSGERVLILLQAQVLGVSSSLAVAVIDAAGKPLALGTQFHQGDPYVDFTFPSDGTVFIQVWSLTPGDQPGRVYRLTVTRLPLLEYLFPAGGRRGQKVELLVGARDPDGALKGRTEGGFQVLTVPWTIPDDATPELAFRVPGKPTFNSLPLVVGELPEVIEKEPNDEPGSAIAVKLPVIINGRLPIRGDVDHFKFPASKGQKLVLDAAAAQLGYRGDLLLTLFDAAGTQLAENNDRTAEQTDPRLEFTVPADGDYIVRIQDMVPRRSSGPKFIYRLAIREPLPDFRLTVKEPTLAIKPGEAAVTVEVEKQDGFDAEIQLAIDGLPADIKVDAAVVPAGQARGVVRLTVPPQRTDQHLPIMITGNAKAGERVLTRRALARVPLAAAGTPGVSSFVTDRLFLTVTNRDLGPPPPPLGAGIIAASTTGWKYIAASAVQGNTWIQPNYDDAKWKPARTPVGYGEDVVAQKKGTPLELTGQNVLFRREFTLDARVLKAGTTFKMHVASDDSAVVWINGKQVDNDTDDHEVEYWNREVAVPANVFVVGRNVIAAQLKNNAGSSDAVFDLQLDALVPAAKPK
jgi:hypothetical protein